MFGTDCECVYTYLYSIIQLVRPTGVVRLSVVEVNENRWLTKTEQTAAVCSGFPNKHSTRRTTERQRCQEGEREKEREGRERDCITVDKMVTSSSLHSSYIKRITVLVDANPNFLKRNYTAIYR